MSLSFAFTEPSARIRPIKESDLFFFFFFFFYRKPYYEPAQISRGTNITCNRISYSNFVLTCGDRAHAYVSGPLLNWILCHIR